MCTVPGWKRSLCSPATIHLQPLFNTAAPVLLHLGDASKSLCVWAQEPRQAQQIPTVQPGADPGVRHTAGLGSAAAPSVRAQRKGIWPRTSILMKEVTCIYHRAESKQGSPLGQGARQSRKKLEWGHRRSAQPHTALLKRQRLQLLLSPEKHQKSLPSCVVQRKPSCRQSPFYAAITWFTSSKAFAR